MKKLLWGSREHMMERRDDFLGLCEYLVTELNLGKKPKVELDKLIEEIAHHDYWEFESAHEIIAQELPGFLISQVMQKIKEMREQEILEIEENARLHMKYGK
jgi:hypothetical protein